jgi:hypothetical protein
MDGIVHYINGIPNPIAIPSFLALFQFLYPSQIAALESQLVLLLTRNGGQKGLETEQSGHGFL